MAVMANVSRNDVMGYCGARVDLRPGDTFRFAGAQKRMLVVEHNDNRTEIQCYDHSQHGSRPLAKPIPTTIGLVAEGNSTDHFQCGFADVVCRDRVKADAVRVGAATTESWGVSVRGGVANAVVDAVRAVVAWGRQGCLYGGYH